MQATPLKSRITHNLYEKCSQTDAYWSNPPVFSRFQPAKYLFNLPSKMSGLSINLPGQLIKRKAPLHILSSLLSIRQLLSLTANIFLIVGECVIGMLFDESLYTKYLSSVHFKDVTLMSLTTHRLLILFNHVQHFYILTHKFTFIYVIYLLLHKQSWLFIKHIPDTLHL